MKNYSLIALENIIDKVATHSVSKVRKIGGPRPEARQEEKGRRKVAKVISELAGAVGNRARCGKLHQGELEQESESCGRRQRRHQRGSA